MATIEVREYQTAESKTPLTQWLKGLRDGATRARIVARLDRLKAGLLGDWKTVGGGVCELRIDHGPGFRVYYGQEGKALILLLCGGEKTTQAKDIEIAHAYWKDYKARLPKPPVQSSGTPAKRGRGRGVH
ncbi:MAG TPA: type II toxin-antitoxin system RelE/ParE family toxin [Steroidobacteraceae bacterium]|nr:type II toxin-antitoxin system RelE/ParE family toxin [Steroidobacteraceae bacterium]